MKLWQKIGFVVLATGLAGCASSGDLLQIHTQAQHDYQSGHFLAAKQDYEELLRRTPGNPVFWARLGNCNALLGDTKAAAADYQRALHIDPKLWKARYNLAILHLKESKAELVWLSEQGDLPEAMKKQVDKLLAEIPSS